MSSATSHCKRGSYDRGEECPGGRMSGIRSLRTTLLHLPKHGTVGLQTHTRLIILNEKKVLLLIISLLCCVHVLYSCFHVLRVT